MPGYLLSLMQIAASDQKLHMHDQFDMAIRQSAIIFVKNAADVMWVDKEGRPSPFSAAEKQAVRDNILVVMCRAPPLIRYAAGVLCGRAGATNVVFRELTTNQPCGRVAAVVGSKWV